MILTITILSGLVILLGYTSINLLKKQEISEEVLANYLDYLDKLSKVIEISKERMDKLSITEKFKSDDEIGFFFDQITNIQSVLNEFTIKNK